MNPDPVSKLARFTPAPAADPLELLFAAGRASARTHWLWKVAVAALLASNVVLGALLVFRPADTRPAPPAAPPVRPAPEPPVAQPPAPPSPAPADDPWSYRALRASGLEHVPSVAQDTPVTPREALTVLSGRRGELD